MSASLSSVGSDDSWIIIDKPDQGWFVLPTKTEETISAIFALVNSYEINQKHQDMINRFVIRLTEKPIEGPRDVIVLTDALKKHVQGRLPKLFPLQKGDESDISKIRSLIGRLNPQEKELLTVVFKILGEVAKKNPDYVDNLAFSIAPMLIRPTPRNILPEIIQVKMMIENSDTIFN